MSHKVFASLADKALDAFYFSHPETHRNYAEVPLKTSPVIFMSLIFLFNAIPAHAQENENHEYVEWYYGRYNRGQDYPAKLLPQSRGEDVKQVYICTGTSCPIRLKFQFTHKHYEMAAESFNAVCPDHSSACELKGLTYASRTLETIVWSELIYQVNSETIEKAWAKNSQSTLTKDPGRDQHFTMDCVDQATNGLTYLIVLNEWGLMHNHKVVAPGLANGIQPHFFSRLQNKAGEFIKFDFYDRENSSKVRQLPSISKESGDRRFH